MAGSSVRIADLRLQIGRGAEEEEEADAKEEFLSVIVRRRR